MMDWLMLLAQGAMSPDGAAPGSQPQQHSPFWGLMFPMLLGLGVFYIFMFRGQRKDRRHHSDMLANLKRSDRVQTIGGVLGTVVDVRDQEVVLKVDETNNVKMRFNRAAIKEVLIGTDEAK